MEVLDQETRDGIALQLKNLANRVLKAHTRPMTASIQQQRPLDIVNNEVCYGGHEVVTIVIEFECPIGEPVTPKQ